MRPIEPIAGSREKPRYATKAKVKHAIEAAQAAGIKIGAIEFTPDGSVRILSDALAGPKVAANAYDDWKRAAG